MFYIKLDLENFILNFLAVALKMSSYKVYGIIS